MKIFHSSPLSLLCLISLIITINSTTVLYPSSELSNAQNTREIATGRPKPIKGGIYNVFKDLCWGCIGESLQYLFAHNWIRAQKWEMPLIWDSQLEKYARLWTLQKKSDCSLQHSFPEGNFKLGENIYWGSGTSWEPTDAVNAGMVRRSFIPTLVIHVKLVKSAGIIHKLCGEIREGLDVLELSVMMVMCL